MVDFIRPNSNQRSRTLDHKSLPTMTKVFGGPRDGTEVLPPLPEHRGRPVCIGLPAPPEYCEIGSGLQTWCVYIWQPGNQRWVWLDFFQAASPDELAKALKSITDSQAHKYRNHGK